MILNPCPREKEVKELLEQGHWPGACAPELRAHVSACRDCSDLALVSEAFRTARKVVEKLKLNYPVAMGDVKLGESYGGVLGLPLTFLIDRRGIIQARFSGEADLNAMEQQLKALLGR